jgi:hypothetical protein
MTKLMSLMRVLIQYLSYQIRTNNDPPIPEDSVIGFDTAEEMDLFLFENQNMTQAGKIKILYLILF